MADFTVSSTIDNFMQAATLPDAQSSLSIGTTLSSSAASIPFIMIADSGGNIRGNNAVDLQLQRASGTEGLSAVASGTRSALLGGLSNAATGQNSVVTGGTGNIASGNYSGVIGGQKNIASGGSAEVIGGTSSYAEGESSTAIGGANLSACGNFSAIVGGAIIRIDSSAKRSGAIGGLRNTVSHDRSVILGGENITTSAINTAYAQNLHITSGFKMPTGASADYVLTTDANGVGTWQAAAGGGGGTTLSGTTSNNTQTEIFVDGVANSRMTIATDTTWMFSAMVAARSATESAGYKIEGVIKNDGGTTSLVGTAVKTVFAEEDATWDITVEADATNDALVFKVTGDSADSVSWEVTVNKTEAS